MTRPFPALLALAILAPCLAADRVLVFSKTLGFRHDDGIAAGIAAIGSLGTRLGFGMDASENSADFTDANLARYKAVIFLSPSGEILDSAQKSAFRKFIRAGNGFVGLHNATAYVLEGWGWYDSLVCARYESEIPAPVFHLAVTDKNHPSTSDLPAHWDLADEDTYNFKANPKRLGATVLVNLDETGLDDGTMGADHPYSWYHAYDGGRAWYTSGGSSAGAYSDSLFLKHLAGGIRYAIGGPGTGLGEQSRTPAPARSHRAALTRPATTPLFIGPGNDGNPYTAQGRRLNAPAVSRLPNR